MNNFRGLAKSIMLITFFSITGFSMELLIEPDENKEYNWQIANADEIILKKPKYQQLVINNNNNQDEDKLINQYNYKSDLKKTDLINEKSALEIHKTMLKIKIQAENNRAQFKELFIKCDNSENIELLMAELNNQNLYYGQSPNSYNKVRLINIVLLDVLEHLLEYSKDIRAINSKPGSFHVWSPEDKWEKQFTKKISLFLKLIHCSLRANETQDILLAAKSFFDYHRIPPCMYDNFLNKLQHFIALMLNCDKDYAISQAINYFIIPHVEQPSNTLPVIYPLPKSLDARVNSLHLYR